MKIKEILSHLEAKFPLYLQEDFDNSGIQCGDKEQEVTGVLVCFDPSPEVLEEAKEKGANLIISHHPLVFTGLKKIEPVDRIGRIIFKAIENKQVMYAMHTNMDSAAGGGNDLFAQKLGLTNCEVLSPKDSLYQKVIFFIPENESAPLKNALFAIGCGCIGRYDHCSYQMTGFGSFRPLQGAQPHTGQVNNMELIEEERVEMIFPANLQRRVIDTIYKYHLYEEPAFDIVKLENKERKAGLGRVGFLPQAMDALQFLEYVKKQMDVNLIRYSGNMDKKIKKVAVCGGGGSSLIQVALRSGADAYVTGDIKYHDFYTPEERMMIADIGHFEGEHFIREIIYNEIKGNFITFATSLSTVEKLKIYNI
ncbi:MAG: Nif3-like dinuclear metal center hexameric protein [Bacteroidales bacterium]|jgi:dinuclear metal center YbgI/SA1388 family protein|nr:Nif3-like dinuclear metal center hexameric protein [Bacteroidales bacterium]